MFDWKTWLKQFDRWESATAAYSEGLLRSPLLLNPIGSLFTSVFQAKSGADRMMQQCWSSLGLPTRGEQERTLHALNQLESRLIDIEEKLSDLAKSKDGMPAVASAPTPAAPKPVLRRNKKASREPAAASRFASPLSPAPLFDKPAPMVARAEAPAEAPASPARPKKPRVRKPKGS